MVLLNAPEVKQLPVFHPNNLYLLPNVFPEETSGKFKKKDIRIGYAM